MAGLPWIQVHNDLLAHPKTLRLAIKLADDRAWTYLVQLWLWASMHAPSGRIEGPGCEAVIARASGWSLEPDTFVRALHEARFLDQTAEGYAIHNWDVRAGAHIAKREKERARVRTWREQTENRTRTERVPNTDVRGERETEREKETKKKPARLQRARRAVEPEQQVVGAGTEHPGPTAQGDDAAGHLHTLAAGRGECSEPAPTDPPTGIAAAMGAPLTPGYVPPGMRPPEPAEAAPSKPLLVVDEVELPPAAALVRGELERQLGKRLAKAGTDGFADQVERLERVGPGEALRVCVEAAAEYQRRTGGEVPGSLAWFSGAMAKFLGAPAGLGAPPPLPPAGCREWEAARAVLQAKVRDDTFRRWLAPLTGRMFNGALVLEAPDEGHAAFVRDNYEALLTQGAVAALGGRVDVVLVAAMPKAAAGGAP